MPSATRMRLPVYAGAVSLSGFAMLGAFALSGDWGDLVRRPGAFWLFVGLVVLADLRPITFPRHERDGELTIAMPFAYALVLMYGTAAASLGLAVATFTADTIARRPLQRSAFNVAQLTLSLAAGGAVLRLLAGAEPFMREPSLTLADLGALLVSGLAFFAVNHVLTSVVLSLNQGSPVIEGLRTHLPFSFTTTTVLLSLSPVVAAAAERGLSFLPLLLLPVAAVYRSARVSLQRDFEALHDPLTGLPNRTCLRAEADPALVQGVRDKTSTAVVILDLDRFKEINDTLGHVIGDQLLREVGPLLNNCVGDAGTVARLGGDEFAALLPKIGSQVEAEQVADRMLAALDQPVVVNGFPLSARASAGLAVSPGHGQDFDTLLQHADIAMYAAKRRGGGRQAYDSGRDRHTTRQLRLAGGLRQAIERDELVLYYQPKATLPGGAVAAVEALARWRHPQEGLVGPGEFIPLAEQTGLMGPLTLAVLRKAAQQCRTWQREGLGLAVAVNLSMRNLVDPQFPAQVGQVLAEAGVGADCIVLEMTESVVMDDPTRALKVLGELAEMGLKLSIDDYGTGYSSLAYIRQLPVSEIKIDRSFVTGIETDAGAAVIVRSTIELARTLGLSVVAEGVETEAAWDLLAELGCDLAQGYLLTPPLPAEDLGRWLRARRAVRFAVGVA